MENGRRDQEQGAESDEDDDHRQNASDTGRERSCSANKPGQTHVVSNVIIVWIPGPGWTANFRDCRENAGSQTLAGWVAPGSDAQMQETGWANFTQFGPFSG